MEILTNAPEKLIWMVISKHPGIDVIRLRKKVNLPLSIFIHAINSLIEKSVLIKMDTKLFINDALSKFSIISPIITLNSENSTVQPTMTYLNSVSSPKINPEEFYLPDQQKFLDYISKRS